MRSLRLLPIIVAATSLLLPSLAGASSLGRQAKHPSPSGRCSVNINAAPHEITAGETVVVFGQLRCQHRAVIPAAGQTVTLLGRASTSFGFHAVQSTTTDAQGFYEFIVPNVQSNAVVYVRAHRATSGHTTVRVAAQVTLSGPPEGTQLLTGSPNKVTFTGSVSPGDTGALVVLQRQNAATGNEWHRIGLGLLAPDGSFLVTHTFRDPGDANLRVLVRSERRNIPSTSNVLNYAVSQTENPALTIAASADPITFGQSVTISGVLAGGAREPVTLEARTARQLGFAAISEVTTDAAGSYTFPAQSPIQSTFYEVKGAHSHSAVLFETVKDLLTAAVSQTTVQAGDKLTFSGVVAPDHTGHVIYLERQNASGTGFHVVQVETVGAGSSYAIVHTVYDTGTKVFEIRIPGGPENGGATSQPFTIEVRPGAADALLPEAPGNSSQPGEGQT
jgi:phage protein U